MADMNESIALDLDLFDNAKSGYVPELKKRKKVQIPEIFEPRKTTRSQIENEIKLNRIAVLRVSLIAIAVLVILGSLIYGRVVLTESRMQLDKEKQVLELAQSDHVRLQMKFNSMMSMDKIEEYAISELGMVKRENYQISYFDISEDDGVNSTHQDKNE